MRFLWRCLVGVAALLSSGCWGSVPSEWVYGTYEASSLFGTETLVLNKDETYEQKIVIGSNVPIVRHGTWALHKDRKSWSMDPTKQTIITLYDFVAVHDGLGRLDEHWQSRKPEAMPHSVSVEWFRVVLDESGAYPYYKQ